MTEWQQMKLVLGLALIANLTLFIASIYRIFWG